MFCGCRVRKNSLIRTQLPLIPELVKVLTKRFGHGHFTSFGRRITNPKSLFANYSTRTSSSIPHQYKIVFIGNDSFSLSSLIELTKLLSPENVSVVVASENNIVGKYAKKHNNKIYLWNDFKTPEFGDKLSVEGYSFDFGVVASFGYLIPARVINRFPLGILNIHGSLLPRWRGASPIAHSIMFGDPETGISIMKIAPHRFDVGPVLHTKKVPLDPHIREPDLRNLLADLGAGALIEVVKNLPNFLNNPIYQDERLATKAPKLVPEMADVDWTSKTAVDVYRLYLALYGTLKLKTTFNGRKVDLDEIELPLFIKTDGKNINYDSKRMNSEVSLDELPPESVPGQIVCIRNVLLVRCCDPTWVVVKKVKLGVKWMNATDFKNGFLSKGKMPKNVERKFEYIISTPILKVNQAKS
ncbi:unnamed protein product [Orchesella dallaii]|uniref:methionyl-tRNA formyltransferase n=1 Tax=Orchesella dallaii TaxID=48710 RepID=A0ABP1R259_9HEXA